MEELRCYYCLEKLSTRYRLNIHEEKCFLRVPNRGAHEAPVPYSGDENASRVEKVLHCLEKGEFLKG